MRTACGVNPDPGRARAGLERMSSTKNPTPCPRCGAPVAGDFKFCPTCAYRLQLGADWEPETPRRRDPWSYAVLVLFLGGLFAAILVIGYHLFGEPSERAPNGSDDRRDVTGPLTVSHLKDRLVHLYSATATYWISPDGEEEWPVQVGNCLFGELEITRGEWREFVEACQADPAAVPPFLRVLWRPAVADEPEKDSAEQHVARAFANQFIDAWWERVQVHHLEVHHEKAERPADFVAPLPASYGTLLLVPPSWVRIGAFEDFRWALPEGTERLPVSDVSWYDAVAFSHWASDVLGISLRLPTAMEWIRAGNGGSPERRYPWSKDGPRESSLPRYACNSTLYWGLKDTPELLRVDYRFADGGPTPEGVQQMSGNAREWLHNHELDARDGFYGTKLNETIDVEVTDGTTGKPKIVTRVLDEAPTLGGSFREAIQDCTVDMSSLRLRSKFGRWNDVGFRLWAPSNWMGG